MNSPAFAVVGHPNKGKSSLVATLAQDDSVRISMLPGTTVESRTFPMQVDGKILYTLIDTPGFQRAHKALQWMKQRETQVHKRSEVVAEFVETFSGSEKFFDECQLLKPILAGAGILYVVDGSKPYGSEFEAEMEILRWTGRPCMALINMIGASDYSDDWRSALTQFFQIVRKFNAVNAPFEQHIELLRAFGQLDENWNKPLQQAVDYIHQDRHDKIEQSARLIAELIAQSLTLTQSKKVGDSEDTQVIKDSLKTAYFNQLKKLEQRSRDAIERLFQHHGVDRKEAGFELLEDNLFSSKTWSIFGLSQQELFMTGLAGGAAVGVAVDVAVGGASLLLGAGIGALIGGVGAMISYDQLANFNILGLPLGGQAVQIGPMKNRNFPYVLLGRALWHQRLILNRTHAMRESLNLEDDSGLTGASQINPEIRKKMEVCFHKMRKSDYSTEDLDDLTALILASIQDERSH